MCPCAALTPASMPSHWIMSERYQYPSEKNRMATEIKHSDRFRFASLRDFLENAPWGEGFHYVTVTAYDRTTKPMPANTTTAE